LHRTLRKLLDDATGLSEFVFAVNIDIRGFSDWSLTVDSAQTALFVKKVYARLIDHYYSEASFYKPTGDGLLVIMTFAESELDNVATKLVADAMSIVSSFGDLCAGDNIINFPTPQDVGIGLARGPASRLVSKGKTLDYSGRVLNLASRLMDLARPRGVILDSGFGLNLLPAATQEEFAASTVYLKGVSPNTPMTIYSWPSAVEIPARYRRPLDEAKWETLVRTVTRKQLEDGSPDFRVDLETPPIPGDEAGLTLSVEHTARTKSGRKSKTANSFFEHPAQFSETAGIIAVDYSQADLCRRVSEIGATWPIRLTIRYRSQ
jgi:class 3 adenylate cyclase